MTTGISRRQLLSLAGSLFPLVLSGDDRPARPRMSSGVPTFEPDPYWPKPLPNKWMLGTVSGVRVDSHDHIWVLHRPRRLDKHDLYGADGKADCCFPAPAVVEFDREGNVLQGWGGPSQDYEWPQDEHGIAVDRNSNIWVTGSNEHDHQILKFTKAGKFLLQIGKAGKSQGSNDTGNLRRPAAIALYEPDDEIFVADGYANRRVIVFDAITGKYKRHWGAYGNVPDDSAAPKYTFQGPGSPQFNVVHGIAVSADKLVYVCDRLNNRIQVFKPDGSFVKEGYISRKTDTPDGTALDVAFSADQQQQFIYVVDMANKKVQIVNRATLEVVGYFGGRGGHGLGDFYHIHSISTDSQGNVYLGEVNYGRRALRWMYKGMSSPK